MTTPLSELYFGRAAAQTEASEDPERFLRTYIDEHNLPRAVLDHRKFLILGPKGTGKSAAGAYVAAKWRSDIGHELLFENSVDYDELNTTQTPLTDLTVSLVSREVISLNDAAWRLFLSVRLLDSLLRDDKSSLARDSRTLALRAQLQDAGLASDDYPRVLKQVRSKKGTLNLKVLSGELGSRDGETLSPSQLSDALLNLVLDVQTDSRHLLVIDGLDKAITGKDSYWLTLTSLIRVSHQIMMRARQKGSPVYLLVLCRSDVFRHSTFSDAPTIAADAGVYLSWHTELQDPREVLLWEYLARKAGVPKEVLWSYLPPTIPVGLRKNKKIPNVLYALERTRYTPRDMTLLFQELQATKGAGQLSSEAVRAASDRFVSNHLVNEIVAEGGGLLPPTVASRLEALFNNFPARVLSKSDFSTAMEDARIADKIGLEELGQYLFLQGAIGNFDEAAGYTQFFHRRSLSQFKPRGPWVLHTGLVQALNIPWTRKS